MRVKPTKRTATPPRVRPTGGEPLPRSTPLDRDIARVARAAAEPARIWTVDHDVAPLGTHVLRRNGRLVATFNPSQGPVAREVCNYLNVAVA